MLTDFLRDGLFTVAWFGLMTAVWLGWAQEDPPRRWRPWLGAGSVAGILCALAFGTATGLNWGLPTALDGQYHWFGVLVAVDVVAAGAGCWWLAHKGRTRWMAWWVAIVVAAHFPPLAWLLIDPSIALLGIAQLVALGLLFNPLQKLERTTSATVGVLMGTSLLAYALITATLTTPILLSSM